MAPHTQGIYKMHVGKYQYSDSDFQHWLSDSEWLLGGGHYGSRLSAMTELSQKDQCINANGNNSWRFILVQIRVRLPVAESLCTGALWPLSLKNTRFYSLASISANYLTQKTSMHLGCTLMLNNISQHTSQLHMQITQHEVEGYWKEGRKTEFGDYIDNFVYGFCLQPWSKWTANSDKKN